MTGDGVAAGAFHSGRSSFRKGAAGVAAASVLVLLAWPGSHREVPAVALRAFPYPYRAALTLASDMDGTNTTREFVDIARYLSDTGPTHLGEGLGLEIAQSFWFYDTTGQSQFTYFQDLEGTPSEAAPVIEEFISAGYIDCLHTYGEFSATSFDRSFALRAMRALESLHMRRGVTVRLWSHHGDPHNTQNLGPLSYERGDDVGAPEYHADLLIPYGVKFVDLWDMTHIIGQDAPRDPLDFLKEAGVYLLFLRNRVERKEQPPFLGDNRLLRLVRLDDGQRAYAYRRFINPWGEGGSGADDLVAQLSPENLDALVRKGGVMIIYTHLGASERAEDYGAADAFTQEPRRAVAELARRFREGEILVTTTSRLLTYQLSRQCLRWESRLDGEQAVIEIASVDDEVEGPHLPRRDELMGLTFYVPSAEQARVLVAGREVTELRRNPPDETGRESVSFPWRPLAFPEWGVRTW